MNRRAAADLAQKAGVAKTRAILKKAEQDLNQRLAKVKASRLGPDSYTAHQLQLTLAQVRDVTRTLTKDMKVVLVDQAGKAADLATQNLLRYMSAANKDFTGIAGMPLALNEALMLERAHSGAQSSVLNRLASSGEPNASPDDKEEHPAKQGILDRYGQATVEHFEGVLQQGLITNKPWGEMRDNLTQASPFLQAAPAFWAERIARTETQSTYNRANWESIRASEDMLGDMVKILAMTDDDRTGWDSYQVHGQIRRPEEAFEWKDGLYQHPPNRPNDREIVVPHRISWPLPPYLKWRTDEAVLKRYMMFRKTGSPGPRPRMTTVPLNRFGR